MSSACRGSVKTVRALPGRGEPAELRRLRGRTAVSAVEARARGRVEKMDSGKIHAHVEPFARLGHAVRAVDADERVASGPAVHDDLVSDRLADLDLDCNPRRSRPGRA